MKATEIVQKAIRGEIRWIDAAGILGVSARQMRRWKHRVEAHGPKGLEDARRGRPPGNRIAPEVCERVTTLYRSSYEGFNVKHFCEQLPEHGIHVSYSWVKSLLHETGCRRRTEKRGTYRRKRDRRPATGMLLHLDGSKHHWFKSASGEMQDLLAVVDDATGEILAAHFAPEESTATSLYVLRETVEKYGTFVQLYTDRASHFVYTPKSGEGPDRSKKTQVERVLDDLGIELICAYSPQARGRSERMWRTLQGRLPQELKRAGISTYEAANAYFNQRFKATFNRTFRVKPQSEETSFVPVRKADLDKIFSLRFSRTVAKDNTFHNRVLQLPKSKDFTLADRTMDVRIALNGIVTAYLGMRKIATFAEPINPNHSALEAA
jgi:transposase